MAAATGHLSLSAPPSRSNCEQGAYLRCPRHADALSVDLLQTQAAVKRNGSDGRSARTRQKREKTRHSRTRRSFG